MIITYNEDKKTLIIKDCFSNVNSKMLYEECMDILKAYLELWINEKNKKVVCLSDVVSDCINPNIVEQEKFVFEYGIADAINLYNDDYDIENLDMTNVNGNLCYAIFNNLMGDDVYKLDEYNEYDVKKIKLFYRGYDVERIYRNAEE